jgi:hypothetical protein
MNQLSNTLSLYYTEAQEWAKVNRNVKVEISCGQVYLTLEGEGTYVSEGQYNVLNHTADINSDLEWVIEAIASEVGLEILNLNR